MINLRPGQREVAAYRGGYLAVPAVPGAGKTTVLAYLAANLIEGCFNGKGKILIVTYMNSAVANFRARIGDELEERGLARNRGYEVRTLHALALNILKKNPEKLMINSEFKLIDPGQRGRVLRGLVEEWSSERQGAFLRYFDYDRQKYGYQQALERWQHEFTRFIAGMIAHFKVRGLTGERVRRLQSDRREDTYLDWAFQLFLEYQRFLHYQGLLDFDDLLNRAYHLLAGDQQFLERLRAKYTYIFEDEAQDSNLLLGKILELLAGETGNLVRVGDSNQAIMGTFTAADPELFRRFTGRDDISRHSILYSSRSSLAIIRLANYLVEWVRKEHPQPECRQALEERYIYPVPPDDPFPNPTTGTYTIHHHTFSTSSQEISSVAGEAARHARLNPENTVAILVPANFIMENIIEELVKQEASFECLSDQLAEQVKTINDLKRVLSYLAEPHLREPLQLLLQELLLKRELGEEADLTFLEQLFGKYSPEELLYPIGGRERYREYTAGLMPENLLAALEKALDRLRLWLEASIRVPVDELVLLLAEQLELKGEELAIAQNMALQLKGELDLNPHWRLREIVDELPRLQESFQQFARNIYERKGFEPRPGVVTITTMHKAKGLEWDTVYLTYLTDDYYPSLLADRFRGEFYYLQEQFSNPGALARASLSARLDGEKSHDPRSEAKLASINERLRLLYVGISRARRNLLLTAHRAVIHESGYRKKVKPAKPFLALQQFISKEREADVEKKVD